MIFPENNPAQIAGGQQTLTGQNPQPQTAGNRSDIESDVADLLNRTLKLEKESKDNIDESKRIRSDGNKTRDLVILGFFVLLIMVATLMAIILINYISIYENYTNLLYQQGAVQQQNSQIQQQEINNLQQKIASQSGIK